MSLLFLWVLCAVSSGAFLRFHTKFKDSKDFFQGVLDYVASG